MTDTTLVCILTRKIKALRGELLLKDHLCYAVGRSPCWGLSCYYSDHNGRIFQLLPPPAKYFNSCRHSLLLMGFVVMATPVFNSSTASHFGSWGEDVSILMTAIIPNHSCVCVHSYAKTGKMYMVHKKLHNLLLYTGSSVNLVVYRNVQRYFKQNNALWKPQIQHGLIFFSAWKCHAIFSVRQRISHSVFL
jgi:hypothetical protein